MPQDYTVVALWIALGIIFVAITLGISWLLRPYNPTPGKLTTYECGIDPVGQAWTQFFVRYYIFALIFVVFDIESVFLYPWAINLKPAPEGLGLFAFWEMVVFLGVLLIGLYYAWRKGVLKWA